MEYRNLPLCKEAVGMAKVVALGLPAAKNVSPSQTSDLIGLIQPLFALHRQRPDKHTAMDSVLVQYLKMYWENHLSATGLRLFALMRFPAWNTDQNATKRTLVDAFLAEPEGVFPCPRQIISDWAAAHTVSEASDGGATGGKTSLEFAAVAVAIQNQAQQPVQSPMEQLLAVLMAAGAGKALPAEGVSPMVIPKRMLPLERHMKEVMEQVRSGGFIDPHSLSAQFLATLRERGHLGGSQQERVEMGPGTGVFLMGAGAPPGVDFSTMFDYTKFTQGMNYLAVLYTQVPAAAARLPDFLEWHHKLWASPIGSPLQKIKYARAFMYKYQLALAFDWKGKFETDYQLFQEFLGTGVVAVASPSTAALRRTDKPAREEDPPKRERGGRRNRKLSDRTATPDSKRPRTPASEMLCNSRRAQSYKECSFTGCRYIHLCASCQGDHAAAACPQWSDAKASAWIALKRY